MSRSQPASVAGIAALLLLVLGIVMLCVSALSFYLRFPAPAWVNAVALPWLPLIVREIVLPPAALVCIAGAILLWRRKA
jgi:hypothetical protein